MNPTRTDIVKEINCLRDELTDHIQRSKIEVNTAVRFITKINDILSKINDFDHLCEKWKQPLAVPTTTSLQIEEDYHQPNDNDNQINDNKHQVNQTNEIIDHKSEQHFIWTPNELALAALQSSQQTKTINLSAEAKLIMTSLQEGTYEPKLCPMKCIVPIVKQRIASNSHGRDEIGVFTDRWVELSNHKLLKGKSDEYILFFTLNHGIKESSMVKYVSILNRHFEHVKGMSPYHLYQYMLEIDKSSSLTHKGLLETYSKLMQVFNRVYGFEHFIPIKRTVTTKPARDGLSTIFNKSNFDAWLKLLVKKWMYEDALLFHLMWDLALRPCEILLIWFEDIVSEDGKYNSNDGSLDNKSCCLYRGKTSTTQLIKISKRLTKHIFEYKHRLHGQVSNQSGTRTHPPYTKTGCFMMSFSHARSVTKRFIKISKVVGRTIKPKDMRTSSWSYHANNSGFTNTATLAGHKSINTTTKYYVKASHAVDADNNGDEDDKSIA